MTVTTTTKLDVKQTAVHIRKELKKQFPHTKFSVRMATGTAYGWIRVCYEDGPAYDLVRQFLNQFESTRFDAMTDSYISTGNTGYDCCGINIDRQMSQDTRDHGESMVRRDDSGTHWIDWEGKRYFGRYDDVQSTVYKWFQNVNL